jgi:hypothetical protein
MGGQGKPSRRRVVVEAVHNLLALPEKVLTEAFEIE